jgi:hypothetical protein
MVNATTSDGNSSDTTCQGGKMERKNNKGDGSSTRLADWKITESGTYKIQDHTETTELQQKNE